MITGAIVGDKEVVESLREWSALTKKGIDQTVQKLGFLLQARVQSAYLRGPRPGHLGVVTSRLINSIVNGAADSRSRFVSTDEAAYYYVGTNVKYGIAWENGFQRRIGAGARGGPRTLTGKARDTYFAKHPPGVKDEAARPFLVPALADLREQIIERLQDSLQASANAALKGR